MKEEAQYRFKGQLEGDMDDKPSSRKELEMMKEAEREFSRFESESGPIDPEFEKELDRLIEEKMRKGYDDQRIIDEISTGGKNTMTA